MIDHVIVEGVDRLGKDTLITGIKNVKGFYQVLHYQKPPLLDFYMKVNFEDKKAALKQYQEASFRSMFMMLNYFQPRIICNRAHLGESVYAKRYRGYDGDYVFNIEQQFSLQYRGLHNILLVLLYTNDFSFVEDDGLSFDVTKQGEEQNDFVRAFDMSLIPNKLMINVNAGGRFKDRSEVLGEVLKYLK